MMNHHVSILLYENEYRHFFHVFISQIFPSIKCQGMPFVQISFLFTSFLLVLVVLIE